MWGGTRDWLRILITQGLGWRIPWGLQEREDAFKSAWSAELGGGRAVLSEKWGPFLKNQQEFQVPAAEPMTLALLGHRGGLLGAVMLEADFKG